MTIDLKIEVLKVFLFELHLASDKKQEKEVQDEEEKSVDLLDASGIKQPD